MRISREEYKELVKLYEDVIDKYCDTVDDLMTLPRCEMGSIAIVLSESAVYMKNGAGKWVKL